MAGEGNHVRLGGGVFGGGFVYKKRKEIPLQERGIKVKRDRYGEGGPFDMNTKGQTLYCPTWKRKKKKGKNSSGATFTT